MRITYAKLHDAVYNINRLNFLTYEIRIRKYEGMIYVEAYEGEIRAYILMRSTSCKEMYRYLTGIRHAGLFMKRSENGE